jgi:hypothetical protein
MKEERDDIDPTEGDDRDRHVGGGRLDPRRDHGARGWLGHAECLDRVGRIRILNAECLRVGDADAERLGRFR